MGIRSQDWRQRNSLSSRQSAVTIIRTSETPDIVNVSFEQREIDLVAYGASEELAHYLTEQISGAFSGEECLRMRYAIHAGD